MYAVLKDGVGSTQNRLVKLFNNGLQYVSRHIKSQSNILSVQTKFEGQEVHTEACIGWL